MSFGWKFTLILGGCVTLYVGGGIVHNKVKGEQLQASNIKRLLPHVAAAGVRPALNNRALGLQGVASRTSPRARLSLISVLSTTTN